jgi:cardiolipin synthase
MPAGTWYSEVWGVVVATVSVASILGAIAASCHAILYKRDTRATVLWVSFIWLAQPLTGSICYLLLGINRIKRRAALLRSIGPRREQTGPRAASGRDPDDDGNMPPGPSVVVEPSNLVRQVRLVDAIVQLPLLPGNRVTPLFNGDAAYPAMLQAIGAARVSVALCTYIFDRDPVGHQFVEALRAAVARGVEVRVLIDDTGARYSLPSIVHTLRKAGIKVGRFLPTITLIGTLSRSFNMRCHRKIMVIDGSVAFTGGMNIRAGHAPDENGRLEIQDSHFRIEGPVVAQIRDVFADDWLFTTGEKLDGPQWFPGLEAAGDVFARAIADGPDETFDRLRWTILGALAAAHRRVSIITPYFLPDPEIISALNTAALRGVLVEVLIPEKNNIRLVQWACMAHLWQVLQRGCRVYLTPLPFDHNKLLIVDDTYVLIGSANWDPRSLRLNFEFNVECYSSLLARDLSGWFERRRAASKPVTLRDVNGRSVPVRLRDGLARLATPFL